MEALFLIEVDNFPEAIADPDSLLLIQDEDESEQETEITLENLSFMSTVAMKSDTPENTLSNIQDWWKSEIGDTPKLELLTDSVESLQDHKIEQLRSLETGSWSLNTSFIAFSKVSEDARLGAINLVKESELKVQ